MDPVTDHQRLISQVNHLLTAEPGLSVTNLSGRLGLPYHTLYNHLYREPELCARIQEQRKKFHHQLLIRRVNDLLNAEPGLSLVGLARCLKLPCGTLSYHLRREPGLRARIRKQSMYRCRCGLVLKQRTGRHFSSRWHRQYERMRALLDQPCLPLAEIARRLGISRQALDNALEKAGITDLGRTRQEVCRIRHGTSRQQLADRVNELLVAEPRLSLVELTRRMKLPWSRLRSQLQHEPGLYARIQKRARYRCSCGLLLKFRYGKHFSSLWHRQYQRIRALLDQPCLSLAEIAQRLGISQQDFNHVLRKAGITSLDLARHHYRPMDNRLVGEFARRCAEHGIVINLDASTRCGLQANGRWVAIRSARRSRSERRSYVSMQAVKGGGGFDVIAYRVYDGRWLLVPAGKAPKKGTSFSLGGPSRRTKAVRNWRQFLEKWSVLGVTKAMLAES